MGSRVTGGVLNDFNQVLIQICFKEIDEGGSLGVSGHKGDQGGENKREINFLAGIKTFKRITFIQ